MKNHFKNCIWSLFFLWIDGGKVCAFHYDINILILVNLAIVVISQHLSYRSENMLQEVNLAPDVIQLNLFVLQRKRNFGMLCITDLS